METKDISDKKQKMIDAYNALPIKKGDYINVKIDAFRSYHSVRKTDFFKVTKVNKVTLKIQSGPSAMSEHTINHSDVISKRVHSIGINPFDKSRDNIRPIAFQLSSILHSLNILRVKGREKYEIKGTPIQEVNWNPFIYNAKGEKERYQRDFVWTINEKRLLIESVYQGIDCGKIIIRLKDWSTLQEMQSKGETELSFRDIVDGKQRLEAIRGFIQCEYTDSAGNYYSDLSDNAQRKLTENQLFSYSEMPDSTTDQEVVRQFLKLNFTGIPQSQEHIDFVKTLQEKK